ncbi:MAG TPA: PQQ-binding-like beta-propeller repeat protein [Verrucomicrobiae bacterium]|nr:PQQ-binding-like beta-propeller repeat protein [Verrucomicrobiae bacterium]
MRGLGPGTTETIPIVHDGVMYVIAPGGIVDALDATSGDLIWEHKREYKNPQIGSVERTKALAIYEDMVYFTAPDGFVVALDVRTGKVRWETYKTDTQNTSGALVIDGKVISGGTCGKGRDSCFIEADNAETGEKVWRFYTVAQSDDPGYASWGGAGRSLPPMLARWRERTGRVRGFGVLPVHAGLVPGGCRFGAEGLPVAFAAGVAPVGVPLSVFV